jgi:hypothetical protein
VKRRLSGPLLVSTAIHVAVAVAILHVIVAPRYFTAIFVQPPRVPVEEPAERIRYLETAPASIIAEAPRTAEPIRAGIVPATPALVAPAAIPTTVPPPAETPAPVAPGTGVVGGTGTGDPSGKGSVSVTPSYTDPRIWNTPSTYTPPAPTRAEELEAYLARGIREHLDSVAAADSGKRDPRDWTKEIGGRKYGVDDKWIHVAGFKVPSFLLAAIPLKAQANPTVADRNRRINEMSAEIEERRSLEVDSRDEIRRINERMDRQRAARLKEKKVATNPPGGEKN